MNQEIQVYDGDGRRPIPKSIHELKANLAGELEQFSDLDISSAIVTRGLASIRYATLAALIVEEMRLNEHPKIDRMTFLGFVDQTQDTVDYYNDLRDYELVVLIAQRLLK